jgi:transcriptional regulator with XRE-family HTH domain
LSVKWRGLLKPKEIEMINSPHRRSRAESAQLRKRAWELFAAGKSQTGIADELGVSQSTVSKYLQGESNLPHLEPQSSWRDVLPIHPAAELFPTMSESELRELGKDIKKNGLRYPIILWRENEGANAYLLDGRNRLDAMESVGLSILNKDGEIKRGWSFRDGDPYDLVLSFNVLRRHLTGEQKRELIAKILKAKPAASNRQIAKQVKADHKTVAAVRAEKESTGEIPQLKKTVGADGKQRKSKKKPKPAPQPGTQEYERDRKECVALDLKAKEAERRLAQWHLDHPATASAEVSMEQRRAEMAQLATAPDDLVDQAIRLVEQMTENQRQEFIARFWTRKRSLTAEAAAAVNRLFAEFILPAPTNGRGSQ